MQFLNINVYNIKNACTVIPVFLLYIFIFLFYLFIKQIH